MGDLIDRQDALDVCMKYNGQGHIWSCIMGDIEKLPSAEPERKTGKWIGGELGECSVCGHYGCASDIWDRCQEHYCPNCGARMEENG